jgi:hypothetical protein
MKKALIVVVLAALVVTGLSAEKTRQGTGLDQDVQASYDPLGVQFVTKVYYRMPFIQQDGMLWESTKVEVGVQNNLSPAYDLIGPYIDFCPIAVFDLLLMAQAAGYFNGLGFGFYDMGGYGAAYDDNTLSALPSKNSQGWLLTAAPTLKLALGPLVILDTFSLFYFYADNGSGYFLERIGNVVLAKSDIELQNQAYLMYTIADGIYAGLNDMVLTVPASGYLSHRLVAMGIYSTKLSDMVSLSAVLQLGTWLAERYYQYTFYAAAQVGVSLAL